MFTMRPNRLPSREEVRKWVGAHGKTMSGSAWAVLDAYAEGSLVSDLDSDATLNFEWSPGNFAVSGSEYIGNLRSGRYRLYRV